jgi:hypothetical protein
MMSGIAHFDTVLVWSYAFGGGRRTIIPVLRAFFGKVPRRAFITFVVMTLAAVKFPVLCFVSICQ